MPMFFCAYDVNHFFDWGWYNCEILFMPMKITVPVWVMDYAHWWPWTCEVLEHCFFYLLLMLLMAVIKPCETSMPKQQLGGCDNLMARLNVSHGFMPIMILVFLLSVWGLLLSMFLELQVQGQKKRQLNLRQIDWTNPHLINILYLLSSICIYLSIFDPSI